jgi:serine/threonine protein kinase
LLGKGDVHPPEVHFSDYSLGGFLQQGGWGTVHAATRRRDGKRVAMKFFGYTEREPSLNDIWNEIDLMLKLAGLSGVVQLEGVFSDSESGLVPNKNPRFLRSYPVIVMELVEGGELYSRIANRSSVTERYLATMFRSTAEGLQGIHSRGFVHRDLKLDNILLLSNEEHTLAKIIDFGLMIRLGEDQDRVELKASSLCGTPGSFIFKIVQ